MFDYHCNFVRVSSWFFYGIDSSFSESKFSVKSSWLDGTFYM